MKTKKLKRIILYLVCLILISLGVYILKSRWTPPRGLEGKYYANTEWRGVSQFVTLDSEISTTLLKDRRTRFTENRFSVEWKGYLILEKSGTYTFATASDDGSDFSINGQRVVDNGGSHGLVEVRGQINLDAGVYPIRIRYFQAGGPYRMDLSWDRGAGTADPNAALENVSSYALSPQRIDLSDYKRGRWIDRLVTLFQSVWTVILAYFTGFCLFRWVFIYKLYPLSYETGVITLLFIAIALIFFYDIIFLDYSLLTGGTTFKPHHVIDPGASALQHEPFIKFASTMYKKGLIPLWNPHSAIGSPLNADMHTAVFFPPHLPLFLRPSAKMWDAFMISRLLTAGFLAYFFFRRFLDLGVLAAFIDSAAFMLCGHLILNVNMVYINAVVLLPGLLYVSELLLRTPNAKNLLFVAILTGLIILGGHPESTFFALFYASCYYLFRCVTGIRGQGSGVRNHRAFWPFGWAQYRLLAPGLWFAGGILLGFLFSAIMLVPFTEFVLIGNVGLHKAEIKLGLFTTPLSHIFELWVPYFWGPINASWDEANWQYLPGYIGTMVALLVISACLQGFAFQGNSLFYTGMILFFLVKCYGLSDSFNTIIGNLSGFKVSFFTRYFPGEFMFSTAALVGVFIQRLVEGRVRIRYLGYSAFLGLASLGLMLALYYPQMVEYDKLGYAIQQIIPSAIFCLLVGIAIWLISKYRGVGVLENFSRSHTPLAIFLGFLLILELFIWMPKEHYKRSTLTLFKDPPSYVKFIRKDPGIFRIYGLDGLFYPNTATGFELDDVGALNAVFNARYIDFSLKLIRFYMGYFEGFNVPNVENRFFSLLNLKYVTTGPKTSAPAPFFTLIYQKEANIYRNEKVFSRAFIVHRAEVAPDPEAVISRLGEESFSLREQIVLEEIEDPAMLTGYGAPVIDSSTAEIISYTPGRVVIKAHMEHPGFLVLGDAYFPGWRGFVDGVEKKIYLTDYLIRSIFVKAGDHTVEFVYKPTSYKLGAWLTLVGCGIAAALWTYSKSKDSCQAQP